MTHTNRLGLLLIVSGLFYGGCSSVEVENARLQEPPPPPVVVAPEPEAPEEPVEVEVVPWEPEVPVAEVIPVEVIEVKPEPEVSQPQPITILGFIKYVELEGGFFGIMTEEGAKFFPEYLEQDFKVDGLNVRVVAKPQEQILGIQMWGTPIEILKIEAN